MTWDRFLEEGQGGIAVRIEIEGLAVQFCSDPAMERTLADGRRVVYCLAPMAEGFTIEELVHIPEATIEVQGNQLSLFETYAEDLSQLFNALPTIVTQLAATIAKDATTLEVVSGSNIVIGDVLHLGTEAVKVTSIAASGAGATLTITRAYWGTIAQRHYSADAATGGKWLTVSNTPSRVRGRRVRVYGYGEGDDLQGDGTQIWLGRANTDPALGQHGTTWRLQVESIAAQLRQKIGSELASPLGARGIFYSWLAPLQFSAYELTTDPITRNIETTSFVGFWETQADFVAELTTRLQSFATAAGFASTLRAVVLPDGTWTIQVIVGASVATLGVRIESPLDGTIPIFPDWRDMSGHSVPAGAVVVGQIYNAIWQTTPEGGARGVPRGFFGSPDWNLPAPNPERSVPAFAATQQSTRVYVNGPVSSDWTGAKVQLPGGASGFQATIASVDTDKNSILLGAGVIGAGNVLYGAAALISITPGRTLATGSIADFRNALISEGPEFANRGTMPFFGDATSPDLADWSAAAIIAARGHAYLSSRLYTVFAESGLDEYLSHHFRLLSLFPALDANGRIGIRNFSTPNSTTDLAEQIDDEILDGDWATLEPDAQGNVNTVEFSVGYDPTTDKFATNTITVQDATAVEDDHEKRKLQIAPKSKALGVDGLDASEATRIALPVLGYFGQPYKQITIAVSWKLFPTRCGDVIAVNSQHLPAFTGLRPMSQVVGIVVGRHWTFGDAHGTLTILVTAQNVAGYAPSAEVASQSNVAGNTWDITIRTGLYAPAGTTEDEFFTVGDVVDVVQRRTVTPTTVRGTISAINTSTHVIRVAFNAAWTPGASLWELEFADYAAATTTEKLYCYIARRDGTIGGTTSARTFAP